jgi:hypothetical protein
VSQEHVRLVFGADASELQLSAACYTEVDAVPERVLALVPESANIGSGDVTECVTVADSGASEQATGFLLVVAFAVPDEAIPVFDDWYDTEHAPLLLSAPSWLRVRRLRATGVAPGDLNCYVLHDLADLDVLDGPERRSAQQGPKRAALLDVPWYGTSRRWMFTPLSI